MDQYEDRYVRTSASVLTVNTDQHIANKMKVLDERYLRKTGFLPRPRMSQPKEVLSSCIPMARRWPRMYNRHTRPERKDELGLSIELAHFLFGGVIVAE